MFKFDRASRIECERKDLEMVMVAQAIKFSTAVATGFDDFVGESQQPSFRLIFAKNDLAIHTSHLNQMTLLIECLCFLLHLLDRTVQYVDKEKLGEAVLAPTIRRVAALLIKMIDSLSTEQESKITESDALSLILRRASDYAQAPSILGAGLNDKNSVLSFAKEIIAHELGRPRHAVLDTIIGSELLRAIEETDLVARVRQIDRQVA